MTLDNGIAWLLGFVVGVLVLYALEHLVGRAFWWMLRVTGTLVPQRRPALPPPDAALERRALLHRLMLADALLGIALAEVCPDCLIVHPRAPKELQ